MATFTERALVLYGCAWRHPGLWKVHAALRRWAGLHSAGPRPVVRRGLRWTLDPAQYVQADVFWFGRKAVWDLYHVRRLLRPGAVVFDVGANFGYYSIWLAKALHGNCTVYAFEPCASTYGLLCHHVRANGMEGIVFPRCEAIGRTTGTASVVESRSNSGGNYLDLGSGSTRVTTVDAFCESNAVQRVDFIKLDVEGMEPCALEGASRMICAHRPLLLVEINPATLKRCGATAPALAAMIEGLGYNLYHARRKRLAPWQPGGADLERVDVFGIPRVAASCTERGAVTDAGRR